MYPHTQRTHTHTLAFVFMITLLKLVFVQPHLVPPARNKSAQRANAGNGDGSHIHIRIEYRNVLRAGPR